MTPYSNAYAFSQGLTFVPVAKSSIPELKISRGQCLLLTVDLLYLVFGYNDVQPVPQGGTFPQNVESQVK